MPKFGLSMVEDYCVVLQQKNMIEINEKITSIYKEFRPNFHIYMIHSRPKVFIDDTSFHITNSEIYLVLKIQKGFEFQEFPMRLENPFLRKDILLKCDPTYQHLSILDNDGTLFTTVNATLLLQTTFVDHPVNHLEVLYIGQAFGKNGERTAFDRLQSHSTLQEIYSECKPDQDIWISLWRFNRNSLLLLDPKSALTGAWEEPSAKYLDHMQRPYDNVSKEQEVNFTEAALIKYFEPKYNDKFKYNFPSKDHSTYSDCYKLKLDYIAVEIDSRRLNVKLWSTKIIQPLSIHNVIFGLNSPMGIQDLFIRD
jgi:hypothetical protein